MGGGGRLIFFVLVVVMLVFTVIGVFFRVVLGIECGPVVCIDWVPNAWGSFVCIPSDQVLGSLCRASRVVCGCPASLIYRFCP